MPSIRAIFSFFLLFHFAYGSTLTRPRQSALIIAFEKPYEQSLLAFTLSDQNIDSTIIVSANNRERLFENLQDIEIITLNRSDSTVGSADKEALESCESLLSDDNLAKKVQEILPTFVIFPAFRHDACLLPWVEFIKSIPVIVTYGPEEDLYAVQRTRIALPIHTGGLWSGFLANVNSRSIIAYAGSDYVAPALQLVKRYIPGLEMNFEQLYADVQLVLSSGDPILRSEFASINHEQPIQIGCHHCRGAYPLPATLQKQLVEFREGSIAVTLDERFTSLIEEIAKRLPQGRMGQAVVWKDYSVKIEAEKKPENLFLHGEVDRQDLIGYARARVLLSHCADGEILETVFHGTPVICFPRNTNEERNAQRAIELGLAVSKGNGNVDTIVEAIEHIHKTSKYREIARGYSALIRDRPLPASDRLVHWLGFLARNADRSIKLPLARSTEVRTFVGDSQLLSGLLIGTMIGVALTAAAIFVWFKARSLNHQKQSRKDKKFNR